MGVQHVVRGVHAAVGPAAKARHEILVEAAAQGLAVGADIGPGDAFYGDQQQVAGVAGTLEQALAGEVGLGQAGSWQGFDRGFAADQNLGAVLQFATGSAE